MEAEKTEAQRTKTHAQAQVSQLISNARKKVAETTEHANAEANRVITAVIAETKTLEKKRDMVAAKIVELETRYAILERGFRALREQTKGADDG